MDTKETIQRIHSQWLIAKEQRRQRCQASNKTEVANRLAACRLFSGKETLPEVARLFKSPQGIEFCLAANFPTLATLRMFKSSCPEQFGIYIDAGNITLTDPGTVILIGRTSATVHCNQCQNNTIVTMHGAAATVLASGWAVVRTEAGAGTNIVRRSSDNAIIL